MDKFNIEIKKDDAVLNFEVRDFAHDDDNRCKFEIYQSGKMIASFEPDSKGFLHICKNCGEVDEATLHLIADKLEFLNF